MRTTLALFPALAFLAWSTTAISIPRSLSLASFSRRNHLGSLAPQSRPTPVPFGRFDSRQFHNADYGADSDPTALPDDNSQTTTSTTTTTIATLAHAPSPIASSSQTDDIYPYPTYYPREPRQNHHNGGHGRTGPTHVNNYVEDCEGEKGVPLKPHVGPRSALNDIPSPDDIDLSQPQINNINGIPLSARAMPLDMCGGDVKPNSQVDSEKIVERVE